MTWLGRTGVSAGLTCLAVAPCWAGPPYTTDDPVPAAAGKLETIAFAAGTRLEDGTVGEVGFDIAYGVAEDIEVAAVLPLAVEDGAATRAGAGDVALGVKYRLLRQTGDGAGFDLAISPGITLPTARRGFGAERVTAFVPLWAQMSRGSSSLFGGGGYNINPGDGNRHFWSAGLAVTNQATERLNIGIEAYHEGASTVGGKAVNRVAIGSALQLNQHVSMIASGGPLLTGRTQNGRYSFYLALVFTR